MVTTAVGDKTTSTGEEDAIVSEKWTKRLEVGVGFL
jgi:hypothetical protein